MNLMKISALVAGAFVCVMSAGSQLLAQEDVIAKRKAIMRANNDAVSKVFKKALEEKDFATIELKAKDIMNGMEQTPKLFPPGVTDAKSRAHPDIWTKTEDFKKRADNTRKVAESLSKAAAAKNESEVTMKMKELGSNREGACGDCHKFYRTDFRKDG